MTSNANSRDPFTGTWKLRPAGSRVAGPQPQRWVLRIDATDDQVRVREEIVFADGPASHVKVDAKFDGEGYPVYGSPVVDTIAYTRFDDFRIAGTAQKAGRVTLTEIVSVSDDCSTLTMRYAVAGADGPAVACLAVFERAEDDVGSV